ncbi:MAG: sugar transferase, partial [Gammaproteobacteria bacterium]|nr:sugar transferase [Gammaproteobacteria bacterium]
MQNFLIRTLDVVLSLFGIIFSLPVMLLVYFLSLFLQGSPLYFQQRVGKDKNLFTLMKFRTMAHHTESVGTHLVDSTSITRLGQFLRKTKLDELPQLFNVLLGSMSLVGPRPCLPNQAELIEEREKRDVFKVRPGITGLAQVNGVDMSIPRKLARYDQLMIQHMCLKLYFKLIITTAFGKGRGDRVRIA